MAGIMSRDPNPSSAEVQWPGQIDWMSVCQGAYSGIAWNQGANSNFLAVCRLYLGDPPKITGRKVCSLHLTANRMLSRCLGRW